MKYEFFDAVTISILLYDCNTLTIEKVLIKILARNYMKMLRTVLNKYSKHHHQTCMTTYLLAYKASKKDGKNMLSAGDCLFVRLFVLYGISTIVGY